MVDDRIAIVADVEVRFSSFLESIYSIDRQKHKKSRLFRFRKHFNINVMQVMSANKLKCLLKLNNLGSLCYFQ